MGNHEKKRAKKRQQKQRELLKTLGLFGTLELVIKTSLIIQDIHFHHHMNILN